MLKKIDSPTNVQFGITIIKINFFSVLPYFVDEITLNKATKQPKFVKDSNLYNQKIKESMDQGYITDDLLTKTCNGKKRNRT